MFYIHYGDEGNILSVSNHIDTELWIETTQEIFDDFLLDVSIFMNI